MANTAFTEITAANLAQRDSFSDSDPYVVFTVDGECVEIEETKCKNQRCDENVMKCHFQRNQFAEEAQNSLRLGDMQPVHQLADILHLQ